MVAGVSHAFENPPIVQVLNMLLTAPDDAMSDRVREKCIDFSLTDPSDLEILEFLREIRNEPADDLSLFYQLLLQEKYLAGYRLEQPAGI